MRKIIISDTSCLILLSKIGELDLLNKIFGEITVTNPVFKEYKKPLPEWIRISKGLIQSVKPHLAKIQETNFRLSNELINKVLFQVNEI